MTSDLLPLKSPDTVSVTATPQAVSIPHPGRTYTLRNAGTGSVYFLADAESTDQNDVTTFASASAATLRTGGWSECKTGEAMVITDAPPWIQMVCASGSTATAYLECGQLTTAIDVAINAGNVGLLSADETEIDLPKAVDANSHFKVGLNAADPGLVAVMGASTSAKADVDGNGTTNAHLRRIGYEVDRLADSFAAGLSCRGPMTGAAAINALTVDADTTAFEASIAIPAGTVAIRFGVNAPCHVVVDASATQIVAQPGKAVPADWFGDYPCKGCTYLHLAKPVGGANVTFEGSWVGVG